MPFLLEVPKEVTMKDLVKAFGVMALVVTVILSIIYLEIGVWQECRATNSWFYCMRVLSK